MTTPSAFYLQHVALDAPQVDNHAFRPFWRVTTRLDRLLQRGDIGYPEWHAGRHFRTLIDLAVVGVWPSRTLNVDRSTGGRPASERLLQVRFDAMHRLSWVRSTLGARSTGFVASCVVDNDSWPKIAHRMNTSPHVARRTTVRALQALAMLDYGLKLRG